MVIADGQTKTGVGFEPAVGSDHVYAGRLEREVSGEHQPAQIIATGVRRIVRAAHHVVPETAHTHTGKSIVPSTAEHAFP